MEPLQFFVHDNEWLEHMEKFHDDEWAQNIHTTTWYCDIGHTPAVQFRNEGDFRSHFEDEHKNASGSRVNALLRRKRGRCQREPVVCPLCEQTPGKITHNMGQGDKLSLLFRHIGDHLKSLAFFSLPSLDNENIADGERSSYAAKVSIRGREGNQSGRSMGRHSGNDSDMEAIPLNFRDPAAELLRRDESISSLNESPPLTDKDIKWDTYPGLLKRKDGHEKAPGGTGHSGSHDASHDLTDLYADQGKMVEAEKMYPRAEKASEKALGHEHRSTLGTISNSGLVYKNEGKNRHTERGRYNKILESNQKVSLRTHLVIISSPLLNTLRANPGSLALQEE